ncbi:hypothetical protein SRB5_38110 [Streptomyces sp. RB5]|uniref:FXSXX-COOH protein n=1 Tax=Streptomyces smaragdinus TaxID=2585196 RepID=A0A7K0CJS9_9ACTN|nr:hypothetical protein [Streptomyces smaragdinus]MQY13661.1 hypothetical protein [Streptomyces smaragdinus]
MRIQTVTGHAGTEGAAAPPLPDLSGVDLRTLRGLRTPQLDAAVEFLLTCGAGAEEGYAQPDDDDKEDKTLPAGGGPPA